MSCVKYLPCCTLCSGRTDSRKRRKNLRRRMRRWRRSYCPAQKGKTLSRRPRRPAKRVRRARNRTRIGTLLWFKATRTQRAIDSFTFAETNLLIIASIIAETDNMLTFENQCAILKLSGNIISVSGFTISAYNKSCRPTRVRHADSTHQPPLNIYLLFSEISIILQELFN